MPVHLGYRRRADRGAHRQCRAPKETVTEPSFGAQQAPTAAELPASPETHARRIKAAAGTSAMLCLVVPPSRATTFARAVDFLFVWEIIWYIPSYVPGGLSQRALKDGHPTAARRQNAAMSIMKCRLHSNAFYLGGADLLLSSHGVD
mmetsp:Transcript_870/g.2904  ORF Transcript_870/g.2904 Transcript_870/m.2904 type:complete len:147 (-) Transcript_870:506-946(-)